MLSNRTYDIDQEVVLRDGITLSGKTHTILRVANGASTRVLHGVDVHNAVVRNLTIDLNRANVTDSGNLHLQQGVYLRAATSRGLVGCTVENVTVRDGVQNGMMVRSESTTGAFPAAVTFTNCEITNCRRGLYVARGTAVSVAGGSYSHNRGEGVFLTGGSGHTVEDATVSYNDRHGIAVVQANGFVFKRNEAHRNGLDNTLSYGIVVSIACFDFDVSDNACTYNWSGGISVDVKKEDPDGHEFIDVTPGLVDNNVCSHNKEWHGIYVNHAENLTVSNNTCADNNHSGILLVSRYGDVLTNTCADNGQYGVGIFEGDYESGGQYLSGNTLSGNGTADLYISPSVSIAPTGPDVS